MATKRKGPSSKSNLNSHSCQDFNETSFRCLWEPAQIIAEELDVAEDVIRNIISLLDADQTIPFIARYRKEKTNDMDVGKLRDVHRLFEELGNVESKAVFVAKQLHNQSKLSPEILWALKRATTTTEIEHIFLPFKTGSKKTLAERAKKAGLEPAAEAFISSGMCSFRSFVKYGVEGCSSEDEVKTGVQHLVADKIAKDSDTLTELRKMAKESNAMIEVSPSGSLSKKTKEVLTPRSRLKKETKQIEAENFEMYFQRKHFPVRDIQPHQVLAINRAETKKVMSVKLTFPPKAVSFFQRWMENKWIPSNCGPAERQFWIVIIKDAYSRLLYPFISREERSRLSKVAEKASIEVFMQNLKRILLAPPVMGKIIMGMDPGYSHGCKIAVISEISEILQTAVIYIHNDRSLKSKLRVIELLKKYRCDSIGIGNGTASRETEAFISDVLKSPDLHALDCQYCIVNENGASIYSVSPLAEKEMPDLDPNLRSAVSIARRLQNPLAELVKIEPKHLGVGMYQHDVSKTLLKKALDGIVEECVSFVGVDVNSCSEELLQYVAGVGPAMAKKIVKHRCVKGPFKNREQLQEVKGLGAKTFQQCAGFIRICSDIDVPDVEIISSSEESTSCGKRKATSTNTKNSKKLKTSQKTNPLDKTWIHPESYEVTVSLLSLADTKLDDIGSDIIKFKLSKLRQSLGLRTLAENLGVGALTLQLILDGLQQPQNFDMRSEFEKPLFKKGLMSLQDLRVGMKLTGRVTNKVHFGAFVDIGVGDDGLLHSSQMMSHLLPNGKELGPGDRVEVAITNMEKGNHHKKSNKVRIGLRLVKVL